MKTSAIRFTHVAKRYDSAPVLRGIDLEVQAGEFFGLAGVNGAGKTSLLKCLLDFVALDGGHITIDGVSHREPRSRAPLAFLPERFAPPSYLTGLDYLRFSARLYRQPFDKAQAGATLSALDFDAMALPRPLHSYSPGMTQKLGLASCLLGRKRIYVLDEPMTGLDPKARSLLKRQFSALRDAGCTLFLTSHALADIDELCDRMAILDGGDLRFVGTPDDCRTRYGTPNLEQAFMRCIG